MKPSLYLGADMDMPEALLLDGGHACVYTSRRPGHKSPNEDAAAVIPGLNRCSVLAVADGVGGLPGGDMASATVLQQLAGLATGEVGEEQRKAVLAALKRANEAILSTGQGGATTVAVAMIDGSTLRTAIVGDSMVVVCGQRGRLKYRSVPQSPVGYAEAGGTLEEDEAMFHPERHIVSNVLGESDMHVELGPLLRLAQRDTVIIASDGLFDNLYVGEVIERVCNGPLATAAARLLDACRERMRVTSPDRPHKPDDLAFILYRRAG